MHLIEGNLEALVTVGMLLFSGVVWLIRLEGKMKMHDQLDDLRHANLTLITAKLNQDHSELRSRHEKLEDKIVEKLMVIEKMISKIEGKLSLDKDENR